MAYTITNECINCGRCQIECPTQAIKLIDGKFFIDAKQCNNCVDYYTVAQCAAICPTNNAINSEINSEITDHLGIPTITMENYWEGWFATYNHRISKMKQRQQENYWDKWFEVYSVKLKSVTSHK